ncbi:four helix bundle protein [Aquimarina sp. SS2-1]|uniref:four helix bundle protein n=1 Tax=Aquimarina besae TaxID=3342247 RepID=UPI00366CA0C8
MEDLKFNFEDLTVYQKGLDFVDSVYDTCKKFPNTETYNLSSQYIRAATSITLNISEGSGNTEAQSNRYLQIALGSIRERIVCSTIAKKRNYISHESDQDARTKLVELSKMITSLQKYLKSKT